jgi:hypothetical protein
MLEQVPAEPALLHAWQVPPHPELQHTPSTQIPLAHSAGCEHAAPFESVLQAPAPLQLVAPEHSFAGSCPAGMLVHVPSDPAMLQAWQAPLHALLQQ